jgi:putative transcriptional regulator
MNKLNKIFSFKASGVKIGKGKLLIAEPFMPDFYFKRAVLLVADYSPIDGSFGLIINKKTEYTIDQISNDFNDLKSEVYLGGPVQTNSLFYLHRRGDLITDSMEISKGVFWGGDFEKLKYLLNEKIMSENDIRFYLGYAGWTPSQLDKEISEKSWLISNIHEKDVFDPNPNELWNRSIQKMGDSFRHWLNFPTNPQWN